MITEILTLDKYNAAYSNMPIILSSDNADASKFNYIINICYNSHVINNMVTHSIGSNIYTLVYMTGHSFKKGDDVLIYTNQYVGYYEVIEVVDANKLVINLILGAAYDTSNKSDMCNYKKYKMAPDLDLKCKLDINSTIKDYVKSNLVDDNLIIDGASTRFDFFFVFGEQYEYELEFEDNAYISGSVAFNNSAITSLTGVQLEIGDTISIQQNMYEWNYSDNLSIAGDNLGFTSATAHSLLEGDDIIITGQVTEPYYNGATKVKSVVDAYTVSTWKTFTVATPTEGGTIVAAIPTEYNTTAKITDFYIDGVLGLVVVTDLDFARNTSPISGIIKSITNSNILDIASIVSEPYLAYDMRIDRLDYLEFNVQYSKTIASKYINVNNTKMISTILNRSAKLTNYNRIEYNSKSFLLVHNDYAVNPVKLGMKYTFYAADESTVVGTSKLFSTTTDTDLYFPVGVDQLIANGTRIDSVGFDLSLDFNDVKYYTVQVIKESDSSVISIKYGYKINNSCNGNLPVYHLMWKDSLGSWITFPFKYVARKSTTVDKSSFYNREGSFGSTTFDMNTVDRGETVYYSKSKNTYDLTSDWVLDGDNILFEDLIKSTEVFLQIPELDNVLVPVTLENKDIQYKEEFIDSLFMYSPTVKVAFNDYRF